MATKYLSPIGNGMAFFASTGGFLNGGKLYTYTAGTTTLLSTYKDNAGAVAHANPIVLNARGEVGDEVYLDTDAKYKFVLKTAADATLWEVDAVAGIKDSTAEATEIEWLQGASGTYVSASSLTLAGDQTATYHVGRRLRIADAGGTKYATITASSYSAVTTLTTLTLAIDAGGSLANPISDLDYGALSATNQSTPDPLTADVIQERTAATGVTIDGVKLKDSQPYCDVINEKTGAAGVTVDGLLIKDGGIIVTQAMIAASAVGQAELKTAADQQVATANSNVFTTAGGLYSLMIFTSVSTGTAGYTPEQNTDGYVTTIRLTSSVSANLRMNCKYVQASPPYDLGDGDVPLFIFAVLNADDSLQSIAVAPDPPWANNGPTCIRPTHWKDGNPWQRRRKNRPIKPPKGASAAKITAYLEALQAPSEWEEIEITQAIKQADMPLIPHPFGGNDLTGKTVVLLDPVSPLMERLLELHEMQAPGETVIDLLKKDYLRIDNMALPRKGPPGVICCGVRWR